MSGIQNPVGIKDISKFEHQINISVNIYGYKDIKKSSCYALTTRHYVNLLYFTAGKKTCIGESLEQTGIETI